MVLAMAEAIRAEPQFVLVITPEGTRKSVTHWRTGFYHIAEAADIPIVPVWFDYSRKEVGIGRPVRATGDLTSDIAMLQGLYRRDMSKNPHGYWSIGGDGQRGQMR